MGLGTGEEGVLGEVGPEKMWTRGSPISSTRRHRRSKILRRTHLSRNARGPSKKGKEIPCNR